MDYIKKRSFDKEVETFEIGTVGFDIITLTGFTIPELFAEPVYQDVPFMVEKYSLEEHDGATCNKRRVTIKGRGYELEFGNNAKSFMHLSLHTNKGDGNNIHNMKVEDVWAQLSEAKSDLRIRFGIELPFKKEELRIHKAEINATFPVERSVHDYGRICSLLSYAMCEKKRGIKADTHAKAGKWEKDREKIETFYLLDGKTIKAIYYDKVADLARKFDIPCNSDVPLARMELKCTEQNLQKLAGGQNSDGKVYLYQVSNENVTSFFVDYFDRAFTTVDEYLAMQKDFLVSGETEEGQKNFFTFIEAALMMLLRSGAESFGERVVNEFLTIENATGLPVLLDLNDLQEAIRMSQLNDKISSDIMELLDEMIVCPENYQRSCLNFIGQRNMYDELRLKILNPQKLEVAFVDDWHTRHIVLMGEWHAEDNIVEDIEEGIISS